MQVFSLDDSFDPLSLLQAKALEHENGTRLGFKEFVEAWYGRPTSQRVLALVGPAGCGKSVIMAYLGIEGGLLTQRKKRSSMLFARFSTRKYGESSNRFWKFLRWLGLTKAIKFTVEASHFFQCDDLNTASVRVCFLSIANQLAVTVPGVKEELLKLDESEIKRITDLKALFRTLLCAPMMRVKPPKHPIVVLLDGLDEVNMYEKGDLVEIITAMWDRETPEWLRVIVSSRPEADMKDKIENTYVLQLDSEENLKDLSMFLRQHLERNMKRGEDVDKAVKIMAKRCDGLFLYAGFMGKMLQERKEHSLTTSDVTSLAKEFPPGLEHVFRKYFTRFLQVVLRSNYTQYQQLFSSMVAARSPLDASTVGALLGIKSKDATKAFMLRMEHLLVVEQHRIRFVHKSMCDFLQDRRLAGRVAEKEPLLGGKELGVSVDAGHEWVASVVKANRSTPFAMEHLIYYLCRGKDWEGVRKHLLDFDWTHAAVSLPGVAKRLVDDTDALYNYEWFSDINVTDVVRTIELGRRCIERDPNSFASQLLGRIEDPSHPILISLAASEFAKSLNIYVPIGASLDPARSPLRKMLDGHSSFVRAVDIDGNTVVSGSDDETVRLWDRRTGQCLDVLEEHSHKVTAVAIDGDTVVSGSEDKTVRLWDRRTGKCLYVLEGHSFSITAVGVDGNTVVSSSSRDARLWDRESGECLHVLIGHTCVVQAVAIDGDTVMSGSLDETARLWDRNSGTCLHVLKDHSESVDAVAINGDTVMSSSRKMIRLWDRVSGRSLQVLRNYDGHINAVAIDGDTVIINFWKDMTLRFWDRRSCEFFQVLQGHSSSVGSLAIDGDTVVSGSMDKTVGLWDRRSSERVQVLRGHFDFESEVAIDGDVVVLCSRDKAVRLWDRRSSERVQVLRGHFDSESEVAIDGDVVVSCSRDKAVRLWDRRSGKCLQVLDGHDRSITSVAIAGDTVVSGSCDGTVRVWNRTCGECMHVLEGHSTYGCAVAIDGDTVVSSSRDNTVSLWDRQSGECLQVLEGHSTWVDAVAIDGDTVVSGSQDKTVRLWDRRTGQCLHVLDGHDRSITSVAIDGDTVVSGSQDKTVRLWDRRSGECLHVLDGSSDAFITSVAIDGDTVVSGSWDKTVRLWNRTSGECLQVLHFERSICGIAVETVEGCFWIVVGEISSQLPHILAPLSSLAPTLKQHEAVTLCTLTPALK